MTTMMRVRGFPVYVVAVPLLVLAVVLAVQQSLSSEAVTRASTVVMVLTAIVAVLGGVGRYRPASAAGWTAGVIALCFFLVGYLSRDGTGLADLRTGLLPNLCTLLVYLVMLGGFLGFVRPQRSGWNVEHLLDIAVVVVSGLLAAWTLLAWPVLTSSPESGMRAAMMAVFPMFDMVFAALLVHWLLVQPPRSGALVLVQAGLVLVVAGDLAISLDAAGISHFGDRLALPPMLAGIALFGTAALLPSMRWIGQQGSHPDRSRQRAVLVGVILVFVASIPSIRLRTAPLDRWMIATLLGLLLLTLLLRSERSRHEEVRARHRADHDALTGLPNRAMLLRAMAALPPTVSVLFIDLNGFKAVNDEYGHPVGDELLIEVGERLRSSTRRSDVLARYGGDEFVVVAAVDRSDADTLANRIRAQLSEPFRLNDDIELSVSASIGIASAAEGMTPASLIRHADQAMYSAKGTRSRRGSSGPRGADHAHGARGPRGGKVRTV